MAKKSKSKVSKSTTVKKPGLLAKIGGFAKKIIPVLSKVLPGVGGVIAKGANAVFNDPEWWSSPEGQELATNTSYAQFLDYARSFGAESPSVPIRSRRYSIAEFVSRYNQAVRDPVAVWPDSLFALQIPLEYVDTYLLPKVRKVVNAVYLRPTLEYRKAFLAGAEIYAIKKTLEKWRFMVEQSLPIFPSYATGEFPMLTPGNKANLDAAIRQLEEKLSASVRLPATLCRYLDWRFERIFRSNQSAKAGLILYNAIDMDVSWEMLQILISSLFATLSSVAQANVDLYNAYLGHTQDVGIPRDEQYHYDAKEFVLRTNLDWYNEFGIPNQAGVNLQPDIIIMDSDLDNRTTFMASTVSTISGFYTDVGDDGNPAVVKRCLFPVVKGIAYAYCSSQEFVPVRGLTQAGHWTWLRLNEEGNFSGTTHPWAQITVNQDESENTVAITLPVQTDQDPLSQLLAVKQLDIYNAELFVEVNLSVPDTYTGPDHYLYDITNIDIDTASVPDQIIATEQKFAFANLASDRHHYAGKNGQLNELARDADEFVKEVTE